VERFGLLASSRTEHVLNTQNASHLMAQRAPSKVLSRALVFSIVLMSLTYTIWGSGDILGTSSTYDGYDGYRKLEQKNNWNIFPSYDLMKVRDNVIIKHEASNKMSEEIISQVLGGGL